MIQSGQYTQLMQYVAAGLNKHIGLLMKTLNNISLKNQ